MRALQYFAIGFLLVLALAWLFGCSGLTQMSDGWCAEHPHAGHARCWGRP